MISERDLRLAKAIVDPYIGQDIIATAVLGTKLGSMLNENAYREVVNNAQRLIDGTECIPQGKTLEFILRKRYVETIKADRKSDLSLSKMPSHRLSLPQCWHLMTAGWSGSQYLR